MILPVVPPYDSLEPVISDANLRLHYDLYQLYLDRVNEANDFPDLTDAMAAAIETRDVKLLHSAQQAQNHELYFMGMTRPAPPWPQQPFPPPGPLGELMLAAWGDPGQFERCFVEAGLGIFGSGWLWLVYDRHHRKVHLAPAPNSDQPWQMGENMGQLEPLLACDTWEHAWQPTYGVQKRVYLHNYLHHLVDWREAERLLEGVL